MEIIPKRRKLAEVFKKAFPGINRGPVAPHKGLRLPVTIALATTAAATVCTITDLLKNRNIDLTSEELQQATTLATEFTGGLYQDVKPQLDQAGFVEPTFQVGVVKQDGQLNIQRYFAADNILFMVPVTDVNGKSGIILRNLSAPFDPLMSLNSARAVDLVTLYQSQNGADLIGISEEGEIVYKAVNAWVDGHINENATIEVMTVDSTGIKDGGFAQLKIENPNSPSVVISAQINPDNPNEVLGQVDQENKRLSKVIPPTPEGLPISLISLSINPVTPTPKPTETPIPTATPTETPKPTATATPTEVPPPAEFLAQIPADKQYEIANGQVLVDGQVWFEINSAGEWQKVQRTITFDLEGGGTIEMFEFDTVEEAFQYIVVKDGATWLDKFDPYWEGKTPEDSAFWKIIKTIPERDFLMGVGLLESPTSQRTLWIDLYGMGDGTMILYRTDEGNLNIIFVDENATELKPRMIKVDFLATMFPPTPQP